jgi:chemotaxis response regulator CheB
MPVTVFVADHTEIASRAICHLLENRSDVELVGEAGSFAETMRMTKQLRPDVLVLDVHMPDKVDLIPEDFKSHLGLATSQLVVVSIWNDRETKPLAASSGAVTLVDKIDLPQTLIPAILNLGSHPSGTQE